MLINCQAANTSGTLQLIKDIAGIILPIIALCVSIIALVLNRKISFKKSVKDKQFELINELISLINKSQINFSWKDESGNGGISGMYLYHFNYSNFKDQNQYLFTRKNMYYQINSFDSYEFLQLRGNQFLPLEIFNILDKFRPRDISLLSYDQIERTDYVAHITLTQKTNELNYFSTNSPNHKTFNDFYNLIIELLNAINNWLQRFGAKELMYRKDLKIHISK